MRNYGLVIRDSLGRFMPGSEPWSKQNKGKYNLRFSDNNARVQKSAAARTGQKRTPQQRANISKALQGRRLSPSHIKNRSLSQSGANNHFWRGGITPINAQIRSSTRYKEWRKAVFFRDDYTCQSCGTRGVQLHADHELPFAFYPQLRFEILNGRTLCIACHQQTPTYQNNQNIYG